MAKAKTSPRKKAGSNRGTHVVKQTKPDYKAPKGAKPIKAYPFKGGE